MFDADKTRMVGLPYRGKIYDNTLILSIFVHLISYFHKLFSYPIHHINLEWH